MQNIKTLAVITTMLFIINQADAQVPPVPCAPQKPVETKQQPKIEIHEVRQQTPEIKAVEKKNSNEQTQKSELKQQQKTNNNTKKQTDKRKDLSIPADKSDKKAPVSSQTLPKENNNKLKNTFKNLKNKTKQKNETPAAQTVNTKQDTNKLPAEPKNIKETGKESTNTKKQPQPKQSEQQNFAEQAAQQQTESKSDVKPSEINDIREQAKFLYNSNKLEEAEELFTKIPDSEKISDDWLFLANIAQDKEKPIDAVFLLKKAIAADDNNYKAHYNLGNLYFYDNKINMAMSEYKKAIKLKKDFAYAYYNKGCCYLKKQSWFNARYEFGLAIKANPQEPAFYYNLAYTCKMMKKNKKAQEALEMYNKLMTQ